MFTVGWNAFIESRTPTLTVPEARGLSSTAGNYPDLNASFRGHGLQNFAHLNIAGRVEGAKHEANSL
jgi:hypothetical protein